jgi:GTPase SAR1 family protein
VSDKFDERTPSSVGACYSSKPIALPDQIVNLQILDTAGEEPIYYRGAVVAVLVFSLVEESTLDEIRGWASELLAQGDDAPVLLVVGNKLDLIDGGQLQTSGESVATELAAGYLEVSAKSGQGIEELFLRIAEDAHAKLGKCPQTSRAPVGVDLGQRSPRRKRPRFC